MNIDRQEYWELTGLLDGLTYDRRRELSGLLDLSYDICLNRTSTEHDFNGLFLPMITKLFNLNLDSDENIDVESLHDSFYGYFKSEYPSDIPYSAIEVNAEFIDNFIDRVNT